MLVRAVTNGMLGFAKPLLGATVESLPPYRGLGWGFPRIPSPDRKNGKAGYLNRLLETVRGVHRVITGWTSDARAVRLTAQPLRGYHLTGLLPGESTSHETRGGAPWGMCRQQHPVILRRKPKNPCAPGMSHSLGGVSPLRAPQGEPLADRKGVHREVESEGSARQSSGPTNRNRIRGFHTG